MYAPERLTAEACVQHEAFAYIIQKQQQQQRRLQRQKQQQEQQQQRPYLKTQENQIFQSLICCSRKTVVGSFNTSQLHHDHNNEVVHFSIPFVDSRLSKWYN